MKTNNAYIVEKLRFTFNSEIMKKDKKIKKLSETDKLKYMVYMSLNEPQELRRFMRDGNNDAVEVLFSWAWLLKRLSFILLFFAILTVKILILPYILFALSVISIFVTYKLLKRVDGINSNTYLFSLNDPMGFQEFVQSMYGKHKSLIIDYKKPF